MGQTVFTEDELIVIREEVYECSLQQWSGAWRERDTKTLDQLCTWSTMVSGPERDSPQAVASILAIFIELQNMMVRDIESGRFPFPPEYKNLLLDSLRKARLAVEQLNKERDHVQ